MVGGVALQAAHVAGGVARHDGIGVALPALLADFSGRSASEAENLFLVARGMNVLRARAVTPFTTLAGLVRSSGNCLLLGSVARPAGLLADKFRLILSRASYGVDGDDEQENKPGVHSTSLLGKPTSGTSAPCYARERMCSCGRRVRVKPTVRTRSKAVCKSWLRR